VVKVMPHPDRVLAESSTSNDNKNSQASLADNSTSTFAEQSTANSGNRDQMPAQAEVATQIVAPHPDNVQSTSKTEEGNTKPAKEKAGDKTNINLSVGATDDEITFLDIGVSERTRVESNDGNIHDNDTTEENVKVHQAMQAETEESKS